MLDHFKDAAIKISSALAKDAKKLTALTIRSKAHWNYTAEQIDGWRDELRISEKYIQENEVHKIELDGLIAGFYAFNSINESVIKLNFFFVDPVFIGKGCGNALMQDFFLRMENAFCHKVLVDSDPNAEAFYLKYGFETVSKLASSIEGRFLPVMEKTFIHEKHSSSKIK